MDRHSYTVYGTFEVTTEGDCEGKSIRYLGTYTGYIDEIAFALADKCYYKLRFHQIYPEDLKHDIKGKEVTISLDIDSGTWDFKTNEEVFNYFKKFFKGRNVTVKNAGNYGTCVLKTSAMTIEEKRAEIMKKLTNEEKEILGLN